MANNIYDERGLLRPEYELTDSQKREMRYKNDSEKIDPRTDYGKGIYYLTHNGNAVATMEQVRQSHQDFFNQIDDYYIEESGKHR